MIRATILGCGSSGGVPRLGGHWGACDPANPRNRRRRCALLVERPGPQGTTRLVIDTGPDFAPQMLDAGVGMLDAVVYTHPHADHIHGIDDIRQLVFNARRIMPVWADAPTTEALLERFGYIFETPDGSFYPPVCELNALDGPFEVDGPGGPILMQPFRVEHGTIPALGFRIRRGRVDADADAGADMGADTGANSGPDACGPGGLVYLPDVSEIPHEAWPLIFGAEVFICDALRRDPHPSHAHLARTLDWFVRSGVPDCVITNMHLDLDHDTVMHETPAGVVPAHDGMVLEVAG